MTRSFVDFIEDLDFFAKPVINFNMRGKEKVSSRIGLFASFLIVSIVLYLALGGLVVVARQGQIQAREYLAYGKAIGLKVDITDQIEILPSELCNTKKMKH